LLANFIVWRTDEIRGDDPADYDPIAMPQRPSKFGPHKRDRRTEGAAGLQIPGVGKAIAGKVIELIERGTFDAGNDW
jgi:hypothetical protein